MNLCDKYGSAVYPFTIKVYDVELDGSDLKITLPDVGSNVYNGQTVSFILCTKIPTSSVLGNVYVSINDTDLKLIKVGNVKADQINCRTKYDVVVATESSEALVLNKLPRSRYPFPAIEAADD